MKVHNVPEWEVTFYGIWEDEPPWYRLVSLHLNLAEAETIAAQKNKDCWPRYTVKR
jgi:hypothetical protein